MRRLNERRHRLLAHWGTLIAATREIYAGKLTYAANFDNYEKVGFWNDLDYIGINSYFTLRPHLDDTPDKDELLGQFTDHWRSILGRVESFRRSVDAAGMPVMFTEIGYTFRRHSTVEPWNHGGFTVVGWKSHRRRLVVWNEQPVDHTERALALRALRNVHRERPGLLRGLLYWKLSTDPGHESIEPFVLHVGASSEDPTIPVLAGFVDRARH